MSRTGRVARTENERSGRDGLIVVIYPYKFHDFVFDLMELESFNHHCDVLVWDLSPITTPQFSRAVSAGRSTRKEVQVVDSLWKFIKRIAALRRRSFKGNVCVLNEVTNGSFAQFICNLVITAFLKSSNAKVVDLYNGGQPLRHREPGLVRKERDASHGFLSKLVRFRRDASTVSEARKRITDVLLSRLGRLFPTATTHRLVAGEDWIALAQSKRHRRRGIEIVRGHSHDYSNHLLSPRPSPAGNSSGFRSAVLLDGTVPKFGGDSHHVGRKVYLTTDAWYPALCGWFDRIETETGVRVEIAGHYKTTHPAIAPEFGYRRVHYGKTICLIRDSEFVITIASTAISHAIILRKPVVFIYSNQLTADRVSMRAIFGLAALLGSKPVNIDDHGTNLAATLMVDEALYREYEDVCLTSAREKGPNFSIILEEVMGIATTAEAPAR